MESHGDPILVTATIRRFAELDASLQSGYLSPAKYEASRAQYFGMLPASKKASPSVQCDREL